MSKRAEEAAMKAYPINSTSKKNRTVQVGRIIAFRNGYELAEKDLEETMERDALKCYAQGYEQAEEDIISIIESRIGEILGDAQPAPVLRAELQEMINKIKEQ